MNDKTKKSLRVLFILNKQTEADRPDIPPTKQELEIAKVGKKELRSLESIGACKSFIINVNSGASKSSTGRMVYQMTSLGYELCKQLGFKAPRMPQA